MALQTGRITPYGDELCGDPDHIPDFKNRWHRTRITLHGKSYPALTPCPITAEKEARARDKAKADHHAQDQYHRDDS